jgi:hypothetical protein
MHMAAAVMETHTSTGGMILSQYPAHGTTKEVNIRIHA